LGGGANHDLEVHVPPGAAWNRHEWGGQISCIRTAGRWMYGGGGSQHG